MTSAAPTPAPQSPRALIITVFGLYVRELGGWISVGRLIKLMGHVGIGAQAVRSSVSRLKKRGVLVSERRDGVAGYALSAYGDSVLAEGDRRIFVREEPQESDWVLAVFSVPESRAGPATRTPGPADLARVRDHHLRHVDRARARRPRGAAGAGARRPRALRRAVPRRSPRLRRRRPHWPPSGGTSRGIDARYRGFVADCDPLLGRWQSRRRPGEFAEAGLRRLRPGPDDVARSSPTSTRACRRRCCLPVGRVPPPRSCSPCSRSCSRPRRATTWRLHGRERGAEETGGGALHRYNATPLPGSPPGGRVGGKTRGGVAPAPSAPRFGAWLTAGHRARRA